MTTVASHSATGSDEEWALRSFDPWDNARVNRSNVWRMYEAMRGRGPVVASDAYPTLWYVTRYDEIKKATLDYKTFSSARGNKIGRTEAADPPGTPLEYDPS